MTTNATRRYTSARRAQQAAQTRADIVAAATELFETQGWRGTTIAAIAERAGVVVDTIYAGFGSKSALLAAAKTTARDGAEEEIPLADREYYGLLSEGTLGQRIAVLAGLVAETNERTRALDAVWREAAASDRAIAGQLAEREAGRCSAMTDGLTAVLGKRPDDVTVDGVWAITGSELYAKLIDGRGWTRKTYERWLAEALLRLLG